MTISVILSALSVILSPLSVILSEAKDLLFGAVKQADDNDTLSMTPS